MHFGSNLKPRKDSQISKSKILETLELDTNIEAPEELRSQCRKGREGFEQS